MDWYKIIKHATFILGATLMMMILEKAGVSFGLALLFIVGHALTQISDYMRLLDKSDEKDKTSQIK